MKKMLAILLVCTFMVGSTIPVLAHGHHNDNRRNNSGRVLAVVAAALIVNAIVNNNSNECNDANIVAQGSMPYGTATMIQIERGQFADVNYANGAYERIYGPRRAFNVVNYTIFQQ